MSVRIGVWAGLDSIRETIIQAGLSGIRRVSLHSAWEPSNPTSRI